MSLLASHCAAQIDDRIAGLTPATAMPLFSSLGPTYPRDPACWLQAHGDNAAVDVTCFSPRCTSGGTSYTPTLITPQHVLFANHPSHPVVGDVLRFVENDGTVHSPVLSSVRFVTENHDLVVGKLDAALPSTITPAKVLPTDWRDYLDPTAVPMLHCTNNGKYATVADSSYMGTLSARDKLPTDATRASFWRQIVTGDSASPAFFLINDEPVLVFLAWYAIPARCAGDNIAELIAEIDAAITYLGAEGYSLTAADLSGFTPLDPAYTGDTLPSENNLMATTHFTGIVNNNWSNALNWDNGLPTAPGGNYDTAQLGEHNVILDLDMGPGGAIEAPAEVQISSTRTLTVAEGKNIEEAAIGGTAFTVAGSGAVVLSAHYSGIASGTFARINITGAADGVAVGGGTITELNISTSGSTICGGGSATTVNESGGGTTYSGMAIGTLNIAADAIGVNVNDGSVIETINDASTLGTTYSTPSITTALNFTGAAAGSVCSGGAVPTVTHSSSGVATFSGMTITTLVSTGTGVPDCTDGTITDIKATTPVKIGAGVTVHRISFDNGVSWFCKLAADLTPPATAGKIVNGQSVGEVAGSYQTTAVTQAADATAITNAVLNTASGAPTVALGASTATIDAATWENARNADPGVANVRSGTTYKSKATAAKTGTLDIAADNPAAIASALAAAYHANPYLLIP